MQVQLLVERDQNECIVNLAGTAYKFKRNEYGHLVSDITDHDDIKWVSDPHNRTAFKAYINPKNKILDEVIDEAVPVADKLEAVQEEAQRQTEVNPSTDTNDAPKLPRFPKKGSKRPPKRSKS
jgi:hypothetical protein